MSARLPKQKKKREENSNECKVAVAKKKGEEDHKEFAVCTSSRNRFVFVSCGHMCVREMCAASIQGISFEW